MPAAAAAVPSVPVSATHGLKRKSIADSITDVSARERANRVQIANINATAKNARSDQWESLKRRTQLDIEQVRLQHQHDEATAQRTHEALMFDKRAALEMAKVAHANGSGLQASYGVGGPFDNLHPSLQR
jgi:hypothetical protein